MKRAAFYIAAPIAAFILAGVPSAFAQAEDGPGEGVSAYAVARVKVLDGSVWVRPSGGGDWEEFSTRGYAPAGDVHGPGEIAAHAMHFEPSPAWDRSHVV